MKLLEMLQGICKLHETIYIITCKYECVCAEVNFSGNKPINCKIFSSILITLKMLWTFVMELPLTKPTSVAPGLHEHETLHSLLIKSFYP